MIQSLMKRIEEQFRPYFEPFLNGPAQLEEIEEMEKKMGVLFPNDLKELYLTHNGEILEEPGLFFGLVFFSLKVMLKEWENCLEIYEDEELQEMDSNVLPIDPIKEQSFNKKWIPIASDFSGNYLGINLDPDTNGTYGQIINFGRDEEVKSVIANSITDLLTFISQTLQEGSYTIDSEVTWSYSDLEHLHFFDALKYMDLPVFEDVTQNPKQKMTEAFEEMTEEWETLINQTSNRVKQFTQKKILHIEGKGIPHIAPLEDCTDVRELVLSGTEITDLSPLVGFTTLKKL